MGSPIESRLVSYKFAVFAIHGGKIELGTTQLAKDIAGEDLSFYSFKGEGWKDHISSSAYEEPHALELASKVETILSIHGQRSESESFVMIGGLDKKLISELRNKITTTGFVVKDAPAEFSGDDAENICNRGASGKGVQLELSKKLRRELWEDVELRRRFISAVRSVIVK